MGYSLIITAVFNNSVISIAIIVETSFCTFTFNSLSSGKNIKLLEYISSSLFLGKVVKFYNGFGLPIILILNL